MYKLTEGSFGPPAFPGATLRQSVAIVTVWFFSRPFSLFLLTIMLPMCGLQIIGLGESGVANFLTCLIWMVLVRETPIFKLAHARAFKPY